MGRLIDHAKVFVSLLEIQSYLRNTMNKIDELLNDLLEIDITEVDQKADLQQIYGWDSLKQVQLVLGIQNTFNIELSKDEIQSIKSIGEIRRVLSDRGILD